jgi:4-amino-4-deoxy-L-arabinose transferase-like glycosyltransferase
MTRVPFWSVLVAIEVLVLVVHLNGLRVLHAEGDEVIFSFLAIRLSESPTRYHLQGPMEGHAARRFLHHVMGAEAEQLEDDATAEVLYFESEDGERRPRYEPSIYDQPLFLHPPVYPYALAATHLVIGIERAVLLSALCHAATILMVALLTRRWAGPTAGLLAAGCMAVEAISWIAAERLWIDAMLQTTVTAAVIAALWSARRGGAWRFLAAGAVLALAGLTKLPAGAVTPAIVAVWLLGPRRPAKREVLCYAAAAGVPVLAWLLISRVTIGSALPMGRPTAWMIEQFPYVEQMLDRSPVYYVVGLLFASPLLLFVPVGVILARRERWMWIPVIWAASIVLALSVLGLMGMGFQLRYLAPALPAGCMLAGAGLARSPLWARVVAMALGAYGLSVGMQTALTVGAVDPAPPHAIFRFVWDVLDYRLLSWFEHVW